MSGSVSYVILADNEPAAPGRAIEHGLSVWIDTGETRILFDAGQGDACLHNAAAAGVDLAGAEHIVFSHGHYDHTGGLTHLEDALQHKTPIHAHPGIFVDRYSRHGDGSMHEVGVPDSARVFFLSRESDFHPVREPVEIANGVWLTGPIPRETPYEDAGGHFFLDPEGARPDPIEDDMALWLDRPEGVWIFLGCAHAGTVNTIRYIRTLTGGRAIYAVVGGMHLRNASPERLRQTAACLRDLSPAILLPCHCTGPALRNLLDE